MTRIDDRAQANSLESDVLAALQVVKITKSELDAATDVLKIKLESAIRALIKPGMTIVRYTPRNPVWLRDFQVLRGNERGTNTFLVASEPIIEVHSGHPSMSQWSCEATPISEKTGKSMNGASHGASGNKPTVLLRGYISDEMDTEGNEYEALMNVIAAAAKIID